MTTDASTRPDAADPAQNRDLRSETTDQVPLEDLCIQIERSTELAVETEDYLSYATVLDLSLGDPRRFTSEQASVLLATLYQSLEKHPIVLYKAGWDLPELLLKYIDNFFGSDIENLPAQRPFRLVMSIFNLLCENGNPRELLIRACELMLSTESERNSRKMAEMSLNDPQQPQQLDRDSDQQGLSDLNPSNIDSAHNSFDVWDDTRHENVKFCTLFEVIRFSLQNIETEFPSSFLLEAARTMLQVADDPNADLLSVSTYARRMFLLARDFSTKNEALVSEQEMSRVRSILVNFLTHAADVVTRKYTLKWAERLYVQMKNKVALAPPTERDFVYTETEYTKRMCEVMSRFAQLLLSYDFDPYDSCARGLGLEMKDGKVINKVDRTLPTRVEGAEVLADNYWSREILNGPSVLGLAMLNTQLHFDGSRSKIPNWASTADFSLEIQKLYVRSQGKKDMLLYWALWVSNYFDTQMPGTESENKLLVEWLHMLLKVLSVSPSPEEQFVTGSIIARALRFQSPDFAYNFCIDIMKRSNSSAEHFVIVETLKMLITGKITSQEQQDKASAASAASAKAGTGLKTHICTQDACLELCNSRRREVTQVAHKALFRLKRENHCLPWYYLNFLAVIPTDPTELTSICDDLDKMANFCETQAVSPSCLAQIGLVRKATQQLRDKKPIS